MSARHLLAVASIAALFGAGCPSPSKPAPTVPPGPSAAKPTEMGFGKLPKPTTGTPPQAAMLAQGGSGMALNAASPMPVSPERAGVSSDMMVAAPTKTIPPPYPRTKPVTVQYNVEGTLPTWGTTGEVLRVGRTLPDTAVAGLFAQSAGLPSAALPAKATITSISLQWKDTEDYQWSFDAGNHMASFWKNFPYNGTENAGDAKKDYDKAEALKIADAFLNVHGFSSIVAGGGTIEEQPWMMGGVRAMMEDSAMYPCPVMEGASGGATGAAVPPSTPTMMQPLAASAGVAVAMPNETSIMPYPCGWWQQQVTVFYGGTRDGKPVVDASGYPSRSTSVTVNLQTKQVTSGNVQLDQNVERASYPLIDQETAKKRLQSGGLNPVWPWGNETRSINVHLTKFDIVWMRYDAWTDNQTETYFIPALRASGTVDRGIKGETPEPYTTLVPLPADDVFDELPTQPPYPVPMPAVQGDVR